MDDFKLPKASRKILIVEDDSALLKALSTKFVKEGYQILEARDGEEGLNFALHEQPDLILLDLLMPKVDGLTMLKTLRENPWGKLVPVIVLTNSVEAAKLKESMELKANNYFIKTKISLDEVVAKVKQKIG